MPAAAQQLTLRDATPSDADAMATLFLAARRTAMPWLPALHSEEETRWWVANIMLRDCCVRVAEIDGRVAGFAATDKGWLHHLYVAPGHQGIGVGSQLLDDAKRNAGVSLQLYVFQRNQRARAFYGGHGFVEVIFSDGSGNEENEPDLVMAWRQLTHPQSTQGPTP